MALTLEKLSEMSFDELKKVAKSRKIQFEKDVDEDALRTLISESLSDEAASPEESSAPAEDSSAKPVEIPISVRAPSAPAGVENVKVRALVDVTSVKVGRERYSLAKGKDSVLPRAVAAHFVTTEAAVYVK